MGSIGKQSIASSFIIYTGFIVGAINNWIFTSGHFTPEQYGLTRILFDIGYTLFALANLGTVSIMYRFYPYYRDRLPMEKRDLFGKATLVSLAGFVVVGICLFLFKDLYIRKFVGNSPMLVQYFYVIYPFTLFFLLFSLVEAQAWNQHAAVATTFFKEFVLRVLTSFIIVLFLLHWLNFDQFILAFSFLFGLIALGLFLYLKKKHRIVFTIKTSFVTRRMSKRMVPFGIFVFLISFCSVLGKTFDTILISSVLDLSFVGIFTFITYLTSIMEAPQRGLIAASIPVIAQAWKDKDLGRINRIYKKSAINMLLFSGFIFGLIALNFHNAFAIFHLDPLYLQGETAFLLLGLSKITELGTGVNSQIIVTSRYWRVDFLTNVLLLVILIPLNYLLVRQMGINGIALATLIAYLLFNAVRFSFIWMKFRMQPFSWKTLVTIGILLVNFFVVRYFVKAESPFLEAVFQSTVYTALTAFMILKLKVSEDANRGYTVIMEKARKLTGL
jgi:O-antigen/teichoic acid export membrane protein